MNAAQPMSSFNDKQDEEQINVKDSNKAKNFMKIISKYLVISKYFVGILLILCVTVIWVASSAWIQYIFGDLNYSQPYFLTYFNTCGFCFWNFGYLIRPKWRVPWNDYKHEQRIIVEDPDLLTDDEDEIDREKDNVAVAKNFVAMQDNEANAVDIRKITQSKQMTTSESKTDNDVSNVHHKIEAFSTNDNEENSEGDHEIHLNEHIHPTYGADHTIESTTNVSTSNKSFASVHEKNAIGSKIVAADDLFSNEDDLNMLNNKHQIIYQGRKHNDNFDNNNNVNNAMVQEMLENVRDEGHNTEKIIYVNQFKGPIAVAGAPRPLYIPSKHELVRPYCMRRIWQCASLFCVFWFIANCLFNFSLNATSVASNTTLSSTSSVWTLLLSLTLPRTRIGALKWVAVCVCMGGTIMVALSDSNSGSDTVYGDIMAIVSAFFYGAYTFILKLGLPDDERYAMGMVFGAVGVINLFFLWPGIAILHVSGVERFAWPTVQQFWPLVLNTLIGTNLSDVLWAQSVVLTSPVVATLGLSLTTPLAMAVDAVWKKTHYSGVYITGAILVMGGFILANLPVWEKVTIKDVFFMLRDRCQQRRRQ